MGIANVNLKLITDLRGWGPVDCVRAMGRTPSFWSDRITGRHNIGAKLARDIEERLGLPRYWLDEDRTVQTVLSASTGQFTSNAEAPPLTIATLLVALASALKLLSPDKRAAVAAQLHALALHPEEAAMREALEKLMESDGAPIPRSAVSTRDFAAPHQSAPQPQEVPAFLKK
ncbi:MAG TPA: hypothetical protein PKE37_04775 [Thiomonas arsenitoxydans]|jgi:hypothetical protein|uniref:hypothetical protein n=1 Tax=Thiomonas TaxID=32012 RepID=UPI0025803E00|nr:MULTISPECIES: hypothetical protein [Thiomonas]HML81067.1 hypothetical protein [Thiomonas arsenitoxydans]